MSIVNFIKQGQEFENAPQIEFEDAQVEFEAPKHYRPSINYVFYPEVQDMQAELRGISTALKTDLDKERKGDKSLSFIIDKLFNTAGRELPLGSRGDGKWGPLTQQALITLYSFLNSMYSNEKDEKYKKFLIELSETGALTGDMKIPTKDVQNIARKVTAVLKEVRANIPNIIETINGKGYISKESPPPTDTSGNVTPVIQNIIIDQENPPRKEYSSQVPVTPDAHQNEQSDRKIQLRKQTDFVKRLFMTLPIEGEQFSKTRMERSLQGYYNGIQKENMRPLFPDEESYNTIEESIRDITSNIIMATGALEDIKRNTISPTFSFSGNLINSLELFAGDKMKAPDVIKPLIALFVNLEGIMQSFENIPIINELVGVRNIEDQKEKYRNYISMLHEVDGAIDRRKLLSARQS